jgi:DNA-binding transcriptional MerR regulator
MDKKNLHKQYRIGDFARFLGVTPEYLKHYEESGLLEVSQRSSGYRYYPFDQSAKVIEYLKLRNYGVPIKEMGEMLSADPETAVALIDGKCEALRREADRIGAILEAHRALRKWYEERRQTPIDWEIRKVEPYYFLPHTTSQDFIRDESVSDLFKDWGGWLPVVKSAMSVNQAAEDVSEVLHWGLAVTKSELERYRMPLSGAARLMTFGRCFVYHFAALRNAFKMADIVSGMHPALAQMRELGLRSAGEALLIDEFQLERPEDGAELGFGHFIIPIA